MSATGPDSRLQATGDSPSAPLLAVEDIGVHFGGLVALNSVTFTLTDGELAALIGPNGAGKSTLFDVISGARRPTTGTVRFRGAEVSGRGPARAMRLGMSRTFQNIRTASVLTVQENILLGLHGRGWHGRSHARRRTAEVMAYVGLDEAAHRFPTELSYGERKRLEVARAIINEPSLLLLDEPFAGLNASESRTMVDLVRRVHSEGTTVLLVEHDMSVVMSLAERVVVLNFGRKLADGPRADVRNDPAVIEAYLGSHA